MIRRILQTSKPLRGTGLWAAGWTAITLAVAMPAQAEMKVVVSSKPAHALVALVMANVAVPTVLVAGSTSPHTYSLRPSDARKVNDANVFFRIGEGLEPFTAKLVKSLPATVKVVSLIDAPKLTVLDRRETGAFESHDHGHSAESKASAKGAPEPEDERDPHIWLDPDNAIAMIDHIAAVLGNLEPANAAAFKANAEMAKSQITALKADLEAQLKLVAAKPFVVLHDAYQYLENRFGLTAVGSIAVNPETAPSGKRLSAIRAKIATSAAGCVFAEPGMQPKVVSAVVENTKARVVLLDPEATAIAPGPKLYDDLMRKLAGAMSSCLAG